MGRWWGWPRYRVNRLCKRMHNMIGLLGRKDAVEPTHFGHAIRLGRDVSVYNLVRVMNVLEGAGLEVWDEEFGDTYVDIDYCRCHIEVDRELTYEEYRHIRFGVNRIKFGRLVPLDIEVERWPYED